MSSWARNRDSLGGGPHNAPAPRSAPAELVILVVDDKKSNLIALGQVLRGVPARLVMASSGEEALALSTLHEFALAILDVQMPGMDGFELAEILLGAGASQPFPILFVSAAFRDQEHRVKGYAAGAVDYLVKPLNPEVLLAKVNVFLELARMRAELQETVRARNVELEVKAAQLVMRNRFKEVLSKVSRSVVRRSPGEAGVAIVGAMSKVAGFLGADRAFVVFDPDLGPESVENGLTPEWSAEGNAEAFGHPEFLDCIPTLLAMERNSRDEIAVFPSFSASRELSTPARLLFDRLAVGGILMLPVVEHSRRIGLLCFGWRDSGSMSSVDLYNLSGGLAVLPDVIYGALQRAEAEARKTESQAQHRLLFATMAQGVIYQSAQGVVLGANPGAERMLGLGAWEMAGLDFLCTQSKAVREDGTTFPFEELPPIVAVLTGTSVEAVMMGLQHAKTGLICWAMVSAVPLFRQEGDASLLIQVCTTALDVTELRRANDEKARLGDIESKARAERAFLARMSHEIRTPMNAVLGYAQLLVREPGLTTRQREYVVTIGRSGEHLMTLVNNVLDVARSEARGETLDLEVVNPREILTDIWRMFRLPTSEKGLSFSVDVASPLPPLLRADAGKIRQILINLLGNAVRYTDTGKVGLWVSATPLDGAWVKVVMEVTDTGIGIPTDRLADIFKPFVQVNDTVGGTGLGLAVCRRLAGLMDGEVNAISCIGVGSSFRLEFRCQTAAEEDTVRLTPATARRPEGSGNVRVLIVDDDLDNLRMLGTMLGSAGLDVHLAETAAEAVQSFRDAPCDIVITDMFIPGGDGTEVIAGIRRIPGNEQVPFLALSASTAPEVRTRALACGAHSFMAKPVRASGLFQQIERLTGSTIVGSEEIENPSDDDIIDGAKSALSALPPARRKALGAALRHGYVEEIDAEVAWLEQISPAAAYAVRRRVDRFEFQYLYEMLKEDDDESEPT